MSDQVTHPSGRRRAPEEGSRRPSPLAVLALVIPLLTVGALALVQAPEVSTADRPPSDSRLTRTTLVCPAALPGTDRVAVGHTEAGARASVETRVGHERGVELRAGRGDTTSTDPLVLVGEGEVAPGLLASRSGEGVATTCDDPAPDQWFTGVAAGAEHSSVLTLVNPDGGPAVADVTVLGPDGPIDAPGLRGVTVPGRESASFDLARVVPSRDELALRVQVSRGRLGAHVEDRVQEIGGARSADWLPAQDEARTTSYLLGLGGRGDERVLALANPGDDEARVAVEIVSEQSEFAPAGLEEVRVAPGAVEVVDLTDVLGSRAAEGATGLRVESSVPVTSTLRSVVDGDVAHAVPGTPVEGRTAAMVPPGAKRLLLAGADARGVATVTTSDGQGKPLGERRVEVSPGRGSVVDLPAGAALVDVRLARTGAVVAVEATDGGLTVLPLSELLLTGRVPDVIPALD